MACKPLAAVGSSFVWGTCAQAVAWTVTSREEFFPGDIRPDTTPPDPDSLAGRAERHVAAKAPLRDTVTRMRAGQPV